MGKILIASTDLMMIQFLIPHVNYLIQHHWDVSIVCSEVGDRMEEVRSTVDVDVDIRTVDLVRSPFSPGNLRGYQELKRIFDSAEYDVLWTNEPVMGVMCRLAARKARKKGMKVLYMAHGFHFYKGAPKLNWLACPPEIMMSLFNDTLVTINWEDYHWARKHLFVKDVRHIDGIGVDFSKRIATMPRDKKRKQLGIASDEIVLLSVGELQKRKNHEPMIRAVAALNDRRIKYLICGRGELQEHLWELVATLGIENQVLFLGYRKDIAEIMNAADIYCHPSLREGLGLASLEAMSAGLPLVTSNVQGIPDYVENGVTGFMCDPMDVDGYQRNLQKLIDSPLLMRTIGQTNLDRVKKYDVCNIAVEIEQILKSIL